MPAKKLKTKPIEELTFEEAFDELDSLVQQLHSSELPLDETLVMFERGQALAAWCGKMLATAELKVNTLVKQGETYRTESFSVNESE